MQRKNYAKMIGFITGLSISLEPTGWGYCNNVSRRKDHADKKLQDYIYMGHKLQQLVSTLLENGETLFSLLYESVETMIDEIGTNTSCGSILLLIPNAFAAYKVGGIKQKVAEQAYSFLMKMKPSQFFYIISRCKQSFIHPFSSAMLPSFNEKINPRWTEKDDTKKLYTVLKNIPLDPVSKEITMVFASTRYASDHLLGETLIPTSEDIDRVFTYHCTRNIDYLVYRRWGWDTATRCQKYCTTPHHSEKNDSARCSMGSISDLVSLTLFYHFYDRLLRR